MENRVVDKAVLWERSPAALRPALADLPHPARQQALGAGKLPGRPWSLQSGCLPAAEG